MQSANIQRVWFFELSMSVFIFKSMYTLKIKRAAQPRLFFFFASLLLFSCLYKVMLAAIIIMISVSVITPTALPFWQIYNR